MNIQITGKNIVITPAIKAYIEEKMLRLTKRDDTIHDIHVTLHIEHVTHIAEATIFLKGAEMHARADSEDMYVAIDLLIDKLLHQVTKHKEKMTDHHK